MEIVKNMGLLHLVVACLLISVGCISTGGFTEEDIQHPCSIITADEMADLLKTETCQPSGFDTKEDYVSREWTACIYYVPNSSSSVVRIEYISNEERTYEEYKDDSCYIACFIPEENLGIGDNSFLLNQWDPRGSGREHVDVVIFKDSSLIVVHNYYHTDDQYPYQCYNETKAKEIAAFALSKLED